MPQSAAAKSRVKFSPEEMRALALLAADAAGPRDNTKSKIARAARVLSLSWRRANALWYGEVDHEIAAAETQRLRGERERLYAERLRRLRVEIADTERLIREARERHEAITAVDRREVEPHGQMVLPLGLSGLSA